MRGAHTPPVMDGSALPWECLWPSDRARTTRDWEVFFFFAARRLLFGALGGDWDWGCGMAKWLYRIALLLGIVV